MTATHVALGLVALSLAIALFSLAFAVARAPAPNGARLGLRGLKRRRALAENGPWATIDPVVRWIGRGVRGLFADKYMAALDIQITRAGDYLGLLPEELIALCAVSGAFGGFAGAIAGRITGGGLLVALLTTGFAIMAPLMTLSSATTERYRAVTRRLPNAIDLLALGMGAGLDFPSAARQVVEKAANASDPLIEEFSLILQSLKIGRTRRQALEEFAHRVPCRAAIQFAGAIVQAELRGVPVAHVLALQAETSRLQRSVNAEVAASKASVKLIFPLSLIFLCVLLIIVSPMVIRLQG